MIRIGDPENLCRLYKDLISKDWFMTLLDLKEYIAVKENVMADYEDRMNWAGKNVNKYCKKPDIFLLTRPLPNITGISGNFNRILV